MKATGIVRRIDDLGRIVIPKEIRRTLRIRQTDALEIYTDSEGCIVLKKYSPMEELQILAEKYVSSLSETTGMTVFVTDREKVVVVAGDETRKLAHKRLTQEFIELMEDRIGIVMTHTESKFSRAIEDTDFKQLVMHPIISSGDILGAVCMVSCSMRHKFGDNELNLVKTAADFFGRHMEI